MGLKNAWTKGVSEVRNLLIGLCAVVLLGAVWGAADGIPRQVLVDHGCIDTARTFGIKFTDDNASAAFDAAYLTFKLSDSIGGACTVYTFLNGNNIGNAGGIIYDAGEGYTSPPGMFWLADSIYVALADSSDLFCWEASTQ